MQVPAGWVYLEVNYFIAIKHRQCGIKVWTGWNLLQPEMINEKIINYITPCISISIVTWSKPRNHFEVVNREYTHTHIHTHTHTYTYTYTHTYTHTHN